jgi:hypothetical protein
MPDSQTALPQALAAALRDPLAVDRVVSRALARAPAERFQSMREFAEALLPSGV